MAKARIELSDADGNKVAEVTRPKRLVIRAPFGAMRAKCFVDLYQKDRSTPLQIAQECRVYVNEALKFRGRVVAVRRDTLGDELSFFAAREPESELNEGISSTYLDQSPTDVLAAILAGLESSPLTWPGTHSVAYAIDRLTFVHYDLFFTIDLLAKLCGNFLWDIGWDNVLRFRPHTLAPEHVLYFDGRKTAFKVWRTCERIKNYFEFYGGVVDENQFRRVFSEGVSIEQYGPRRESLFVRPITTENAYGYLRSAVLEQAPWPVYEKYVDLFEEDLAIGFGDTLRLVGSDLCDFDEGHLFRVKMEEIVVTGEGRLSLRYHLADLWESASRFLKYEDHEVGEPPGDYVARRIGSFQIDFSALDSQAHLD